VSSLSSSFHVHAHAQVVTDLQLFNDAGAGAADSPSHMLTSSFDHSLKLWDLAHQDNISTFNTAKVVTSLHYSTANRLILTSHTDDKIRLFDPRSRAAAAEDISSNLNGSCIKTFGVAPSANSKMPPQWVSQVRWHPTSAHVFASVDYSGAVKLWDMRTMNVPLHTAKSAHEGKGLCIDWVWHSDSSASIISGGSDCCVKSLGISDMHSLVAEDDA
jgi:ribosome biogenesis protein